MFEIKTATKTLKIKGYADACDKARELSNEEKAEFEVTSSGAVVFVSTPVPAGVHFTPWTRVETPKNLVGDFPAPHIEGFRPAYTRVRVLGTAYRGIEKGSGWMIHDGRSNHTVATANTKETAHVFTEMRLGRVL